MQRLPRGPRPSSSGTEDRKAIEQRARDAAVPFAPEKKGQWPFPIEDLDGADEANGANGSQEVHNASDGNNASDCNNASHRSDDAQSVRGGQADQ